MSKTLKLLVSKDDDGRVVLRSPGVGRWVGRPSKGQIAESGHDFGVLEVLGRRHALVVPDKVRGVIRDFCVDTGDHAIAVGYGDPLVVLSSELSASGPADEDAASVGSGGDLVFTSPSSGRFYLRPAPDKDPFVKVGDEIAKGDIVFLLEVMKTFSRIAYEGEGLPDKARVLRIAADDGDDLEPGQTVLELESL